MNENISSQRENPREALEKALPEIQKILLRSYEEQADKIYTRDEIENKVRKLCQEISTLLQGRGISIEATQSGVNL